MDFHNLLSVADHNKNKAQYEASIKTYSSNLPPPKKVPKSNVMSANIKKFLEKRKAEEAAKAAEEKTRKEQLLALRAQSSKNSKKAKIMASRTKDNDFSKIKLTEDEIEAKNKREAELLRKNLNDKVARMKARIEMEEKEKLLPKKRKRKSKTGEIVDNYEDPPDEQPCIKDTYNDSKNSDKKVRKPRPQGPTLSFSELLKVAQNKQYEPIDLVPKKKEEERPMTKKEKRNMEMEQDRLRRKEERMKLGLNSNMPKPSSDIKNSNKRTVSDKTNKPVVIHVEKEAPKLNHDPAARFKIPKSTAVNGHVNRSSIKDTNEHVNRSSIKDTNGHVNRSSIKDTGIKSNYVKPSNKCLTNKPEKSVKSNDISDRQRASSKVENTSLQKNAKVHKVLPKKNGLKVNPAPVALSTPPPTQAPAIDEAALIKKIREQLGKEMQETIEKEVKAKLLAKYKLQENESQPEKHTDKKTSEISKQAVKKQPRPVNGIKNDGNKPTLNSKIDANKILAMKKQMIQQKRPESKLPEKKVFHKNPYLDPPRRLLEPRRPPKVPLKRRIESDDEEDDDMSDFIDDGPSQNEEDYSKYIKEIFGYDKTRYIDDDDDDIMETSFAEQQKEEVRSAKLGYLEDLEEERLEMERKKKKKKIK